MVNCKCISHSRMCALSLTVIRFYLLNVTWSDNWINKVHIYLSVYFKYYNILFLLQVKLCQPAFITVENTQNILYNFKILRIKSKDTVQNVLILRNKPSFNLKCVLDLRLRHIIDKWCVVDSASEFLLFHLQQTFYKLSTKL